ncbi:MAG: DUF4065 domain-containing protein [Flavobacteriaceae bacterium]|nr:DUF4065 domain-containing protein [Flavobacteriaceae bacterium]
MSFRKNEFEITEHFYVCEETKEEFTTSELDEINISQVYNQYRDRFGLPFPDQIKRIREKYGVSAIKMSEILGLGANSYRLYEQGEVPSVGNGRLILGAEDPRAFKRSLIASEELIEPKDFQRINAKVDGLIEAQKINEHYDQNLKKLFDKIIPDQHTGYRLPDFDRISNIVLFFSERTQTWKTKLNKLLFYCDFLSFKNFGHGISGLDYRAIKMGPVPSNFDKMYELISEGDLVRREYIEFENGNYGSYFKPCLTFNESLFEEKEIEMMKMVSNKFKYTRPSEIISISHKELAWKNNIEGKNIISYKDYGFSLEAI